MKALLGYTGFVGSNIAKQMKFERLFNSKNSNELLLESYDLVVCSAIRAEKFLANKYPEEDKALIVRLQEQLKGLKCKTFVLISTIDVVDQQCGADEHYPIDIDKLEPYGRHRYEFEQFVCSTFSDVYILRLPALFGDGLKKNFIFDIIHKIPTMIMKEKFNELLPLLSDEQREVLTSSYQQLDNGNYSVVSLSKEKRIALISVLEFVGFTSAVFTDSRSEFQFYDLNNIGKDIDFVLQNNIPLLNVNSEPMSAKEIAKECFDIEFDTIIHNRTPIKQDVKTAYSSLVDRNDGYLYGKEEIIVALRQFKERVAHD